MSWAAEEGEQPQIHLTWKERDGPPVADDAPEGFGTKLIEQACAYELDGAAELRLEPKGLTAGIVFPVSAGE